MAAVMSNTQRPVVNQRLYFCRLHLDWLESELSLQVLPKALLEQSLGESLLFHLVLAYRAYLLEIAQACSVQPQPLYSARQLLTVLERQEHYSGEASELAELESGPSWLSGLLGHYEALDSSHSPEPSLPSAGKAAGDIPLSQLEGGEGIAIGQAREYLDALNKTIENQRLRLEEW